MVTHGVPRTFMYAVLLAATLLAALEVTIVRRSGSAPQADTPQTSPLLDMELALARGDVAAAAKARHDAYRAAVTSRRWEGYLAAGEAVLRLAEATQNRSGAEPEARRLYFPALFSARGQQSLEGVLLVTEALDRLGDRDAVEQGLGMARDLAGSDPDAQARVRRVEDRVSRRTAAGWEQPADIRSTDGAPVPGVR